MDCVSPPPPRPHSPILTLLCQGQINDKQEEPSSNLGRANLWDGGVGWGVYPHPIVAGMIHVGNWWIMSLKGSGWGRGRGEA